MSDLEARVRADFIEQATNCEIVSNIELANRDKAVLFQLNQFSVMQVEEDEEVLRDPRKIFYKTDEELKCALTGLCLAVALTKSYGRKKYNKEFFEGNIKIYHPDSRIKKIDFGEVDRELLSDVLNENLIFDWMVYRDNKGRGIMGLADYRGIDLEEDVGFRRGGTPVYEFARFERKYYKKMREKVGRQKDDMQDAFRRVFAEAAAKKLTEQIDPVEFTAKLFSSSDPAKEIANMMKQLEKQSEFLQIEHRK